MKNIKKHLFICLSLAFVVASCGVQKRLHNPGFYVQLNKNYKKENVAGNLTKAEKEVKTIESSTTLATLPVVEKEVASPSIVTTSNEITINNTATTYDIASTDESMAFPTTTPKKNLVQGNYSTASHSTMQSVQTKTKNLLKETRSVAGGAAATGGATLVLYVILCLFPLINLIPVYLTDGAVTMNFWLTLILDLLTVIGGIIFALLVVLGVVSIA